MPAWVRVAMGTALFVSCSSLALAQSVEAGKKIFARRCQTCHGDTGPADSPIGPDLRGIIGKKAGSEHSGTHSRAAVESGVVWDRQFLRRFLSAPQKTIPGTIMPVQVTDPRELDELLDYLESLR